MVAAAEEPSRRPRLPSPAEKRTAPPNGNLTASRRSLHNFNFPPTLSWGNQRVLRCVNLTVSAAPNNKSESETEPKPKGKRAEEEAESSPARPWNLRTRRSNPNRNSNPSTSPNPNQSPSLNRSSSPSPSPSSPPFLQVERASSVKATRSEGEEAKGGERCKFAVALTKEEIDEDFLKIKGSKPPRRPKKRAKYVQRQLDSLFPGLWLSEITPDLYKIDLEST